MNSLTQQEYAALSDVDKATYNAAVRAANPAIYAMTNRDIIAQWITNYACGADGDYCFDWRCWNEDENKLSARETRENT